MWERGEEWGVHGATEEGTEHGNEGGGSNKND